MNVENNSITIRSTSVSFSRRMKEAMIGQGPISVQGMAGSWYILNCEITHYSGGGQVCIITAIPSDAEARSLLE